MPQQIKMSFQNRGSKSNTTSSIATTNIVPGNIRQSMGNMNAIFYTKSGPCG